ncbi:hypothetical protein CGSMWGv55152_03707 [Gardnerella vaginalis 55152]|uniref:Uncharacterized protein n=2 Tax=Gardnerella vaginalis TaxID=2702 RepID=I4LTA9_GARVA|nr:hypothetical protein CGSMWGv55152_03707 [Gardnerella vaginalis 55152]EIK80912.1 hypothetical protein CGSMWGv1400E_04445 [Gardnerella vaginalis 1400E]
MIKIKINKWYRSKHTTQASMHRKIKKLQVLYLELLLRLFPFIAYTISHIVHTCVQAIETATVLCLRHWKRWVLLQKTPLFEQWRYCVCGVAGN